MPASLSSARQSWSFWKPNPKSNSVSVSMYSPLSGAHVTVQKNCAFCPSRSFCSRTHWLRPIVQFAMLDSRL